MPAASMTVPVKEAGPAGPDDLKMAALYDKAQTDPNATPEAVAAAKAAEAAAAPAGSETPVPEWLPEKFHAAYREDPAKALEAVTKSYGELEKAKGKPAEADPAAATPAAATPEAAAKAVAEAGLDLSTFTSEFAQNGKLAETSYATLAEKGIARETVDSYIAGQQAIAAAATQTIYDAVGGKESYVSMLQWASQALSPEDVAAYDSAMEGTAEQVMLAVEGLQARFRTAKGNEPKLLNGGNADTTQADVYEDTAQLTADMGKPEYEKSPAFRAKVAAKLARSNIM